MLTAGLRADEAPAALPISFMRSYPEAKLQTVPMGDVRYRLWNMDPLEQFSLAALAGLRRPQRMLEIGTFDGSTTLLLARMVPTAQIYTLDLPLGHHDGTNEVALAKVDGAGSRFKGRPEADRITQLYGDSRLFDFSPYYRQMDLVVVDGSHEADCVTADSENALRIVKSDGVVVWDDYADEVAGRHRRRRRGGDASRACRRQACQHRHRPLRARREQRRRITPSEG